MAVILRAITVLDKGVQDVCAYISPMATPTNKFKKNAIKARAEARSIQFWRPATLKRKIGYHDESNEDEEEIMRDAARMKID
jgi:hypothetical protein